MNTILVFFNQILTPALGSGGDVLCAEIIRRWKGLNLEIIGSQRARFLKKNLRADYFYSLPESFIDRWYQKRKSVFLIAPLYIWRGLGAIKLVRNLHPEVIYTTGDFICNTLPAFTFKKKNPQTKWIANIFHLNLPPIKRKMNKFSLALGSFLLQRVSFFFLKKADLIFLLNNKVKKSLIRLGFNAEKLIVLGAGIDFARINKIKSKKPRRDKVIFLGRLNLTKGIFDLPKIWPLVLEKVPEAKLVLIGAGEEKTVRSLKDEFAQIGVLDSIEFKGFIKKSEDVYRIMKQGKLFVFPSHEEGFGIAPLEAQACGLPVVAWNLPVFDEVFPKGMIKVEIGKIEKFTDEVIKLLMDGKLYRKLSGEAINNANRYNWDRTAEREFKLIREVASK